MHFLPTGIVAYGGGFIIALFQTGGLYYVDPSNNVTEALVPLGNLTLADGLELVKEEDGTDTLYVTEGGNQISVYRIAMEEGATSPSIELLGVLKTDAYDTPGTSAVVGDKIWTTNLGDTSTLPAPGESDTSTYNGSFSLVGLNRFVTGANKTSAAGPSGESTSGACAIWSGIRMTGILALGLSPLLML